MATSRALIYLMRRRHLLPCTAPIFSIKTNNLYLPPSTQYLAYSDHKSITKSEQKESESQVQVGFKEAVKENTKSAWYLTVIVAGVAGTAVLLYAIFRELFSSKSPNSVYNKAIERCLSDPNVANAVGEPIKAYGEETRRGRRSHVAHTLYKGEDGVNRLRMMFYIQGSRKHGTVNLEMREDSNGNWMYRYLFIQLKDMSRTVLVLEDNREVENIVFRKDEDAHELVPPGLNKA